MSKIVFLTASKNISTGSYRIWMNDLNKYMNTCGYNSSVKLFSDFNLDSDDWDVVICGKNDHSLPSIIKGANPSKKVGIINPPANGNRYGADFAIAGSIEEMCSLSYYDNVFLFPLIEDMYQDPLDYKIHSNTGKLKVVYHGNSVHLNRFEPHLKRALERLDAETPIELVVISPTTDHWTKGVPEIKNVTFKEWKISTIKREILECDIGIVPNSSTLPVTDHSPMLGKYNTDYLLRFKNKSNSGRSFVFHQLGIPVVADITPSNFHILGNPKNGSIASNEQSWYKSLSELRDPVYRQSVADNAKEEFDRLYDPLEWASKLYREIENIL